MQEKKCRLLETMERKQKLMGTRINLEESSPACRGLGKQDLGGGT